MLHPSRARYLATLRWDFLRDQLWGEERLQKELGDERRLLAPSVNDENRKKVSIMKRYFTQ
jgi:hypothetical protein